MYARPILRLIALVLLLYGINQAFANAPGPVLPPLTPPPVVLDVEKLRTVPVGRFLNDEPTCQVLVVGGGLGGVAAAEDLSLHGFGVIIVEPTSHLGGQLTAQGICTPDEDKYIRTTPGSGTLHYRQLRDQIRAYYASLPGIVPAHAANVGQCWVSGISGEPSVWEAAIRARLAPYIGGNIQEILLRNQIVDVRRYPGNGWVSYADFVDLDTGRMTRIGAQYVLDASEMGGVLNLAGCPWTIGQESQATYGEPDAPPEDHPEWRESFTYSFATRWVAGAAAPSIEKPANYEAYKALGRYSLNYDYPPPRGTVTYDMLHWAPGASGPFWTYRRFIAASSFTDNPRYTQDAALINWQGNDYAEETLTGKSPAEQVAVLTHAKEFSQGFLYWLETECPRDDGGIGYPEIQPAADELGTDGFAPEPYLRDSRRLLAVTMLTENDMIPTPDHPDATTGTNFFDSVGLTAYNIDIHPDTGQPPLLKSVLPYTLPLGAFIPRSGPPNVVPANKNIGASRIASATCREHESVWLIGEIAGELTGFCLRHNVLPAQVRNTPELLAGFQAELEADGIWTRWSEVQR